MDQRTSLAVETLLSLARQQEWTPPSPASSTEEMPVTVDTSSLEIPQEETVIQEECSLEEEVYSEKPEEQKVQVRGIVYNESHTPPNSIHNNNKVDYNFLKSLLGNSSSGRCSSNNDWSDAPSRTDDCTNPCQSRPNHATHFKDASHTSTSYFDGRNKQ